MSYENIKLNLNGNLYPLSQQNDLKEIEDFESVFFSEDGKYCESWASFSDKQVNNNDSSNVKNEKEELTEEEILIQQLEAEIAQLESEYSANQEGKGIAGAVGGFFSSCWNGITGKGFKNNDRAELDAKIAMLEAVKSDPAKLAEAYKSIMGTELTEEVKQSAVEAQKLADSMSEEEKQQVVEMLQEQAASLSTLMEQTQEDQGWFSKAMGGLNNVLGFGTNSNKANAKVEEYIKQVNSLDPNDPDFAAKYQALTGEALTVDGLDELSQGVSKVGNSPAAEAIMDYEETQAAAKEIGSGIVTGVVVAVCVIAAPFTGGASIALGAAVGGATTVLINGTDTIGTSKKYSLEQGILDFGGGAINGAITAMTLGSAGIAGKGFSALKGAGSAAAKQGAKQMVSGGFKNTVKTAFNGIGKSALNGAKIAAFAASSNYLLDTVGTNALYDITGNLAKSETPANIVQNEDGTYSVYYELTDANTGEVISYEIETVDSLAQDEDGGLIKGNVVDVSRSNDFSFTEMAKQTAISAGTAALGAGIGKITGNIINPYATSMTNSVILGNTAEIASDMTLSLSADYLIASAQAGQFVDADEFFSWDRILGEGQNQIRGLLIGIASSKMNSLDAASVDAVRAGFDGKTGSDGAEIPVVKPDDVPETEPLTSSATKSVETPDNDAVPPATIKPEPDDNEVVLPATIKPEPADNAATEPIKIDGVELPKTQQEALTIAVRLIIEENNPTKARELLSAYGMSDAAIETFVVEAVKVQTEKTIKEIKTPNKPAGRTPTQTDFSDPKYSDVVRMSSEIRAKFQQQMGVITEPEIDAMVKNITQQFPDVSETEVLDIMTRLTQFSSFTSLDALGKKLSGLDIGRFYAQGVNTGTALGGEENGQVRLQEPLNPSTEIKVDYADLIKEGSMFVAKTAELGKIDTDVNLTSGNVDGDFIIQDEIKNLISELGLENEFKDTDIRDISRIFEVVANRFARNFNDTITYDALLSIMKAGEFYYRPSNFLTDVSGMVDMQYVGRAYLLAELKNTGIVTNEMLDEITGAFIDGQGFSLAFNKNLSGGVDYFKTVLETCGFDNTQINTFIEVSDLIGKGDLHTSQAKNIMSIINLIDDTMSQNDIIFCLENMNDCHYYTPEEYIQTFNYFKNLATPDGKSILGLGELSSKIDETYSEGVTSEYVDETLYSNIRELMSINPSSVEASYVDTFLELIQRGDINPSALRLLSNLEMLGEQNKWTLSTEVKSDIELLYDVIVNNTNKANLQSELAQAYTPKVLSETDGIAKVQIGESFVVDGEDFIRIKISDTESQLMNITKETYYKLFPPIDRFSSSQQVLGDCYCIETLMSLYSNKTQRANIVSLFSEVNGDVIVSLPNGRVNVTFKNAEMPVTTDKDVYSTGAEGFRMLEYAFGINQVEDLITKVSDSLPADKLVEFTEFIEKNGNNVFIYDENGSYKWTTFDEAVSSELYKTTGIETGMEKSHYNSFNEYLLGNGGNSKVVFDKLGYKSDFYLDTSMFEVDYMRKQGLSETEVQNYVNTLIEQFKFLGLTNEDIKEANGDLSYLARKFNSKIFNIDINEVQSKTSLNIEDLKSDKFYETHTVQIGLEQHAWSLTKGVDESGQSVYYLYNPHNQALPIKIYDIDKFFAYEGAVQNIVISSK